MKPAATAAPAIAESPHRHALGTAPEEALPVELVSMAGGERVLAIADEGERGSWARTIDGSGALGAVRRFEGAHVVTAFDGSDGRATFVTSDGDRLCLATFAADKDAPDARGCEALRPEVVVPIGDRLAMISVDITETKGATIKLKTSAAGSGKKSAGASGHATKATDASATKPGAAKAGGAKAASTKKKTKAASHAGSKAKDGKKKHHGGETVTVPAPKARVDLRVAWASRDGAFETSSAPAGVVFERPLAGMMIADVAPRGAGADLLFYEAVSKPKQRPKSPMGSARLGIASLGADGKLVQGSRGALTEGDLEYGFITGQNGPRLVASAKGTALVTFAGRGGACQVERLYPSFGTFVLPKAPCLVDPLGAAIAGGAAPQALAAAERLLGAEPRRAPGQTRADAPIVAWAGDRAMFVGASGFSAAARGDGAAGPAAAPFVAKRSRIAWSAFAPDGEGIALAGGRLYRIDAGGAVTEAPGAEGLDSLGLGGLIGRESERPRVARIGEGFWLARGEVVRLFPRPMKLAALAGRGAVDATALVGGRERGMFLEVASGLLRVTFVSQEGALAEVSAVASPVRAGFDAVPRAAGGAIVAGVSAADPTKVVALAIGPDGKLDRVRATSLAVAAGAFGVRLVALPGGGALLFDRERRRVVWLDDDGAERAAAALPSEHANAICVDGRAAPLSVPSPEPGKLVRVDDLAVPGTCIVGDFAWTANGGLRWFGASARGLDSIAEAGVLDAVVPGAVVPGAVVAAAVVPAAVVPAANASASIAAQPSASVTASAPGEQQKAKGDDPHRSTAGAPTPNQTTSLSTAAAPSQSAAPAGSATAVAMLSQSAAPAGSATPVATPSQSAAPASSAAPAASASAIASPPSAAASSAARPACPAEMVSIGGRFCVDRFESMLVDGRTGRVLSPDFPGTPNLLEIVLGDWATERTHWGDVHARAFPLPEVPSWQRGWKTEPVAVAIMGARPNGYVTGLVAEQACAGAGKRLCSLDEFTVACRGENDTDFPYGTDYQDGVCNVYREEHPAGLLHHNASYGHLDPRLNRVRAKGRPLFETAGARPACRSTWGSDAVYDLVGNLDEWVDEGGGAFAGGFYSRSTRAGCDAVITAHPKVYADYSTGVRCCKDADK